MGNKGLRGNVSRQAGHKEPRRFIGLWRIDAEIEASGSASSP